MICISAFTTVTNGIKDQYPIIESIKSFLEIAHEVIVVDGGSTDGTLQAIRRIGDPRIKIISNDKTKWPENYKYAKIGENLNIGYENCVGDLVIRFDADFVLGSNLRTTEKQIKELIDKKQYFLKMNRKNFNVAHLYYHRSWKILGINNLALEDDKIEIKYGIPTDNFERSFIPVIPEYEKDGLIYGKRLETAENTAKCGAEIFNYDCTFRDLPTCQRVRNRHRKAEARQFGDAKVLESCEADPKWAWNQHMTYLHSKLEQVALFYDIDWAFHPKVIQERVKTLRSDKFGHSMFGLYDKINKKNIVYL